MSNDRVTFTKTATTKAKKPRTWEITYTLIDGPAIKPKKPKKADGESEQSPKDGRTKRPSKRKKPDEAQQSLSLDR